MVQSSTESTAASLEVDPRVYLDCVDRLPLKLTWKLAGWLIANGDLAEADSLLDRLERLRGVSATLCEHRARLARAAGDTDAQIGFLRQRVTMAPSNTGQIALATALLEAGQLDESLRISGELDRAAPELQSVVQLRIRVAEAMDDRPALRAAQEELLRRNPDAIMPLIALAELDLREGNAEQALTIARHAFDLAGDEITASQAERCAAIMTGAADMEAARALQPVIEAARARAAAAKRQRDAWFMAELEEAVSGAASSARGPSGTNGRGDPVWSPSPPARPDDSDRATASVRATTRGRPYNESPRGKQEVRASEPEVLEPTPDPDDLDPRVLPALREYFGYERLRPGQGAVIANVLAGLDTLATMPTGAGKSLTFQLPAMLREGTTLVLSPLIALMADQVASLPPAIREKSLLVNSTLTRSQQLEALERIARGDVKLVYAAPERLRDTAFLDALYAAGTGLVVIDEAHCISLWGHDFRPDYLTIPRALPSIGTPSVLAITATATPGVANGIADGLGRPLDRIRASVFRPNLFYEAHHHANREQKVAHLIEICQRERGAGIVYVPSRDDAERLAGLLRSRRISAVPYHAGLDKEVRAENQRQFMSGEARVVVATVAFGMGINKADVRFIVHFRPPMSIAAYAQESGRAGRDGKPARCVLLVTNSDRSALRRLAHRDEIDLPMLRQVYAAIQRQRVGRWAIVDFAAIEQSLDVDENDARDRARIAVGVLDQAGLITRHLDVPVDRTLWRRSGPSASDDPAWNRFLDWAELSDGGMVRVRTANACAELGITPAGLETLLLTHGDDLDIRQEGPRLACLELQAAPADAQQRLQALIDRTREETHRRIDEVFDFADTDQCRHVVLAAHLGERIPPCGGVCDVCSGTARRASKTEQATPAPRAAQRRFTTAADAIAVLRAVRTLPFPMGRPGLVRLVMGSAESRVRADRSDAFGVLKDVVKSRVEALIDKLVEDEYLFRDMNHEFFLISLTAKGARAVEDDLAGYNPPSAVNYDASGTSELPLDDDQRALFERLAAWRSERASRDGVPAYVVAHDAALRAVARQRPGTPAELGAVPGFGGKRVAKYGDEILAITNGF